MGEKSISVIVPCYNESRTIYKNLDYIYKYLKANFRTFELIAVNDGSTDTTVNELKRAKSRHHITVISYPQNQGKGHAVREGFKASKHKLVMFLDADLAIPIEELHKFIKEIEKGADIAIASRFVPGLDILKPVPIHRVLAEKAFRLLRILVLNNGQIRDTQCGFKVFKRSVVDKIFPRLTINRFAFDAEMIFLARRLGYKIVELSIKLQNSHDSHISFPRDPINMSLDLIRIRVNSLRGRYRIK